MSKYTVALLAGFIFGTSLAKAQGTIEVNFVHLESNQGQVIVSLYNRDEGFPDEYEQAYQHQKVTVKDKKAHHTFRNIPWGDYAVAVMHDENGDNEMEKNFLGIPKEKVGMSKVEGGIPSYRRAKFTLSADRPKIEIIIKPFN
jgi:uncharacterized protein (DUF2141 family)